MYTLCIYTTNLGCDLEVFVLFEKLLCVVYAGASGGVEMFALHTLPQVLERTCGYKLFIAGRDSLPGQGTISYGVMMEVNCSDIEC